MSNWTLFSNHGHVLVCLANDSESRLRDVAADVGITERAVQKIVRDLQTHGMISVTKHGRRNRYRIHQKKNLRHELEAHCTLGDLMKLVATAEPLSKETKSDYIARAEDVSGRPKVFVPEPDQQLSSEPTRVAEPEEVNTPESNSTETKPEKSIAPDNIERQQGSLF